MLWILLIHVNGNKRRLSIPIPVYPYLNSSINQSRHSVGPSDFPDPESTGISCCRSVPALRSLEPGPVPVKSVYLS
jgi:hypothetical protein